jgi:hypothetical protein
MTGVDREAAPPLPVSIRSNTDDAVSVTIGHTGEALLVELRSVVGPQRRPERAMFRT